MLAVGAALVVAAYTVLQWFRSGTGFFAVLLTDKRGTTKVQASDCAIKKLAPIGRAKIVRPGRDVTVVALSRLVHEAIAAADERGIAMVFTGVRHFRH